tara:strand:+ start:713 stop:940 length:228 start_codon:yes stop_codon:yes gene_type:complete
LFVKPKSVIGNVTRNDRDSTFAVLVKFFSPFSPEFVEGVVAKDFAFNSARCAVTACRADQKNEITVRYTAEQSLH